MNLLNVYLGIKIALAIIGIIIALPVALLTIWDFIDAIKK